MNSVTVKIGNPKPFWKEGMEIWLKFHKNKSRRKLGYVRKAGCPDGSFVLSVTGATPKEKDNYKSNRMIKRLK